MNSTPRWVIEESEHKSEEKGARTQEQTTAHSSVRLCCKSGKGGDDALPPDLYYKCNAQNRWPRERVSRALLNIHQTEISFSTNKNRQRPPIRYTNKGVNTLSSCSAASKTLVEDGNDYLVATEIVFFSFYTVTGKRFITKIVFINFIIMLWCAWGAPYFCALVLHLIPALRTTEMPVCLCVQREEMRWARITKNKQY